ncbi:hypothetical protein MLD38_018708 [Melastoma candidum]|uniref:Uncharacterized protein n=1 Tax=Melastoma candidum TaxID=119954 RepID=A0ACB9QUL4_9MYRT|nr:hypothetical protein MLD38_018708 [Melastoma candidum]
MEFAARLRAAASVVLADDSGSGEAATFDTEEAGIKATLKPHQTEGVSWLIRRYRLGVNVVLGDEMGLGKTLQAISFLSYLKVSHLSVGPFLILCPLSVIDGWVSEVTNFAPKLTVLTYVGEKENRRNLRQPMFNHTKQQGSTLQDLSLPFDMLLTTYDIALVDREFLCQIPWQYAVVDEAQRLKNPDSVLYKALLEHYVIPRRLLMTGTPIQNNLAELWALLHFCMPLIFGTLEQFLSTFKEAENPSSAVDEVRAGKIISFLRFILRAFMLRRTKLQLIEKGTLVLPSLTEITVMVPMVSLQQKVYVSILRKELPRLLALSSGTLGHQSLQNIVIQLRKACSHPYLFPGIEPEPYEEGEHLVKASGKLIILDRLLQKLYDSGHRVLLFAQMTHTLDILQDYLEFRKYSYERLDGSIRAEERFAAIRSFSGWSINDLDMQDNENCSFVFLISTRAGGVGLNLVAADTVIFFEQDWNPQVDKQALQRAHRIGQLNHVIAINIVTSRSIEEVIMRRAERKMLLSQNIVDGSFKREETAGVDTSDLRSFIFGLQNFDPTQNIEESEMSELDSLAQKVTEMRHEHGEDRRKIEMNYAELLDSGDGSEASLASVRPDTEFDEASYLSWIEKFKESSNANNDFNVSFSPRKVVDCDNGHLHMEAVRKKEERKLQKWESLGYHSLSVEEPMPPSPGYIFPDSGSLHFVYGDCTQPSKVCPSEPAIIFSCVDNSGRWGHGGMFDSLAKLSSNVASAYERAAEFHDLHLGDLHLIKIEGSLDEQKPSGECSLWVALAVVQSYNPRRIVPRSDISIPDLDRCLAKVSHSAAQNCASIHMPRIGYGDGSDRSVWYSAERLQRKYAAISGTRIFVYYYRGTTCGI